MKKIKPWMWAALAVGGFLALRSAGFLRGKPKDILEIEKGQVTFTVPKVEF